MLKALQLPTTIREIFPGVVTPKRVIVIVIVIVSMLALISCGSTNVATQMVEHTSVDTVYLRNIQYDSIYIYQDKLVDRSRDTLYIKDKSIEYRYKLLRDTVKVIQRDSIPYQVTITEVKEVTRPLTWYDHLTRSVFWLVIGILFVLLVRVLLSSSNPFVFKLKEHFTI